MKLIKFYLSFLSLFAVPKKYFFFDTNSRSSNTTNNDNSVDNLGVQEVSGSANLTKGSNNTITDGGAIAGAFGAVNNLIKASTTQAEQNKNILTSALSSNATIKQEALKGDAGKLADIAKAGLAVFAVVAIAKAFKKGKA